MVKKSKIPIISELTPQGLLVVGLIVLALLIVNGGWIILAVMFFNNGKCKRQS